MNIPKKLRPISIVEFAESLPVGQWAKLPVHLDTAEFRKEIESVSPLQRTLELHASLTCSARDVATECAGFLDRFVSELLTQFSVPGLGAALFGPQGKVRDADLRQDLAHALGLISNAEHAIHGTIRKVRNRFAHDPDLRFFEHDEKVMGYIQSLPLPPANPFGLKSDSLKERLILATQFQVLMMQHRLTVDNIGPRQPLILHDGGKRKTEETQSESLNIAPSKQDLA